MDEQLNPGIRGLLSYRPETGRPLSEVAEALLRGPHPLTPGERELIAAYVSGLNQCTYCRSSHGAFAAAQLDDGASLVEQVLHDPTPRPCPPSSARPCASPPPYATTAATSPRSSSMRHEMRGATDLEIHDTVLIAAAFCMYNRYVDGLATFAPQDRQVYDQAAARIVEHGYLAAPSASS